MPFLTEKIFEQVDLPRKNEHKNLLEMDMEDKFLKIELTKFFSLFYNRSFYCNFSGKFRNNFLSFLKKKKCGDVKIELS